MAALAALVVVPALASCSSVGFNAPTDQVYTPAQGVNNRDGDVNVLNALVISGEAGSGRVIAGLANQNTTQPDEITGIRGAGENEGVQVTALGGEAAIPAAGFLQLADPGSLAVLVSGEEVVPGGYVRLTFTFASAEEATLNVPVITNEGAFAEVEIPSADPTTEPEG